MKNIDNESRSQNIAVSIKENLSELSNMNTSSQKKLGFSDYTVIKKELSEVIGEKNNENEISVDRNIDNNRKAERHNSKKDKFHESLYLTQEQGNMAEEIKLKWRREGKKVTKSQVYIEAIQLLYDKTFLFGKTK